MNAQAALVIVAFLCGCCARKEAPTAAQPTPEVEVRAVAVTGPPAIVYRTRVDVGDAVPITLTPDWKEVVSYPHPADLKKGDGHATPTSIGEGYLLDNRGIGPNTVFLKWSYAEYAALPKAPALDELLAAIEHRDPFAEMYDCGPRNQYTDPVKELGEIARTGSWLSRCKRLR